MKRIDNHYFQHEIEHLLHFEKGFFYTVRELLIRPGKSVRTFIHEERSRLIKPIVFIIITSLLYSLATGIFHFDDKYISITSEKGSYVNAIGEWVRTHYGYANILMAVVIMQK